MLDLGIVNREKTDNYETKFLNELTSGEEISGEIYIGEIKNRTIEKSESYEFAVILTDHENRKKWVCRLITSYYPETGNIYGEKDGRIYILVDTLNHAVNKDPRNLRESYSVNFNTFRTAVNDNINKIKVKAIKPVNPHAKYVNLEVISAKYKETTIKQGPTKDRTITSPSNLEDLADKNAVINISYTNLQEEEKEITVQNIAFELKSMMDRDEITEFEFKNALKKLDTLPKG